MYASYALNLEPLLPWEVLPEERKRFNKILLILGGGALLLAVILTWIDVPDDRQVAHKVPDRLVQLVLEKKQKKVIPPPVIPKKEEKKVEEKKEEKPKEKKVEPKKEEPKKIEEVKPKPEVVKPSAKQIAEERVAVFDAFADLRENETVAELQENTQLSKGASVQQKTQRAVIGDSALKDSGGINTSVASSSRGGGGSLRGAGTTSVASKIEGLRAASSGTGDAKESNSGQRTSENIQLTFDQNQGRIYTAYYRALRDNPTLQGKVVFKLKIASSGKVLAVSIVSSQLNDNKLERRLISAIKRLNFGSKATKVWEGTYSIDFAPQ